MNNKHHDCAYSGEAYMVNECEFIQYIKQLHENRGETIRLEDIHFGFRFSVK